LPAEEITKILDKLEVVVDKYVGGVPASEIDSG
jgi:hypothetical protein